MEHSAATYEAFDGLEIRLLNDRVVRCDALTVKEAVGYLRLLGTVSTNPAAHARFMAEFPTRLGLDDVLLADLGLIVDGIDGFGDLTVRDGINVSEIIAAACGGDPYAKATADAQVRVFDEVPLTFGLDAMPAVEVFAVARRFAEALYLQLYGMARDFSAHLTQSPEVKVFEIRADPRPSAA